MENNNSKLVEDLENGEFLNEIIESNREMDNLLLESNFVLETAESELKATIKEPSPPTISEDEDTSSALSIEVSEDLFKGYNSDIKFSPIRSTSLSENQKKQKLIVPDDLFEGYTFDLKFTPLSSASPADQNEKQTDSNVAPICTIKNEDPKERQNSLVTSDNLNNLLDDFNATLKNYNEVFQLNEELNDKTVCNQIDTINDDNDKTLVAEQNKDENTKSDTNKSVQVKPLVLLNSEDEYDYLYADMYNTTLEITVPNMNESTKSSPKIDKLKHQDHFEGCSQDFDSRNVGNEFTVILKTDPTDTDCNTGKTGAEDLVSSELSNDTVDKASKPTTPQYDFTSDDINVPFINVYETEVKNFENTIEDEITSPVNEALIQTDLTNENSDIPLQIATTTSNEVVNINNEITNDDMSDTFHNFIQSNIENIDLLIQNNDEPQNLETDSNNCDLIPNNNNLKITDTATEEIEITLNENNNIVNLKRPAEDITVLETDSKRQKVDEKPATITSSTNIETIEISDDPTTEINFTQAIFDAEETADHNDPKWSELKDLETNEDYFKSVRTQWSSLSLPNPHKSNTTRFVPKSIANIKPETATSSETEKVLSCEQFLTNRMQSISKEINKLVAKLNHMPRFKSRSERQKIHLELESLKNLKHEMEKNQEEIKHINMFYCNDDQGWNANYLTKSELEELKEQDRVMQFQKTFYKS